MNTHPNIVILGTKHCNSSITARQLLALGWKENDLDEHGESVSVRNLNDKLIRRRPEAQRECSNVLSKLQEPWVLKDPKFRLVLHKWILAFTQYTPILFHLFKNPHNIIKSHVKRSDPRWGRPYPVTLESVEKWDEQCRSLYNVWPWKKISVSVENIIEAMAMFNADRSQGHMNLETILYWEATFN